MAFIGQVDEGNRTASSTFGLLPAPSTDSFGHIQHSTGAMHHADLFFVAALKDAETLQTLRAVAFANGVPTSGKSR